MPTNFTALDLFVWHEEGSLELSPKFQRRSVWSPAARSFFIDTLLRGFPVPPLHIRMIPGGPGARPHREVIDGQQRLRAVFDFMSGKFSINRAAHSDWPGKTMDQLEDGDRERLGLTQFHVYQYQAVDDATVLEIFSRLNTYSVALSKQELRNGKYFGEFKTLVYELARQYLEFWRGAGVFSETSIARMAEAEFVSELLVLQLDGFQDKKSSLDSFYSGLDQEWPNAPIALPVRRGREIRPERWLTREESRDRFESTMSAMVDSAGDLIPVSPFRRVPLLYTLFAGYHHASFGIPREAHDQVNTRLDSLRFRAAVEELSSVLSVDTRDDAVPAWQRDFAVAAARQTDNIGPRRQRFETLWRLVTRT